MNKTNFKIIFVLIVIGIFLHACGKLIPCKPNDLKEVLKNGRLVVLTDSNSLGFAMQGDSIFGFQYEIIKAFADSLNVELIVSDITDFNEAVKSIESGEADIIASIMPVTTQYAHRLAFTDPLFQSALMLVQNRGTDSFPRKIIETQAELAKDTVYITQNSKYKQRLENLSDEIADTIHIIEVEGITNDSIIKLVASGVYKYAVCPSYFIKHYALMFPNLDFSLPVSFIQNYSWAAHINSASLINKLNEFLLNFIDSYEYRNIYRKYFDKM